MKKLLLFLFLGFVVTLKAQIPTDSLALWLRSDIGVVTSGADVLQWEDQSGHGRHAIDAGAPYSQLVPNQFCGQPSVQFNGNTGLVAPSFATWANKRGTMIVVARVLGGNGAAGYGTLTSTYASTGVQWQFGANTSSYHYYDGVGGSGTPVTVSPPTVFGIVTAKRALNDTMDFYKSGVLISRHWINDNQPDVNPFFIGFNGNLSLVGGEALYGDICEVIFYNKALSPAEQYQVDTYLANKYCLNTAVPVPVASSVSHCGPGAVQLVASGGTHYRWYAADTSSAVLDTNATFQTPFLTQTDTFYLANYNDTLESVRVPVVVEILPIPNVVFALEADTVCLESGAFPLTGGSPAGGSYSGPGVGGGMFDPGVGGVGSSWIYYTFTDSSGCTATDSSLIWVDICMGVEEATGNGVSIKIFPVPAFSFMDVEIFGNGISDGFVEVYGMKGERVVQKPVSLEFGSLKAEFDVSHWTKGVYKLIYKSGQGVVVTQGFVIQ